MLPFFFFLLQVDAGRFPTAYHLDPSAMENPEEMAEVSVQTSRDEEQERSLLEKEIRCCVADRRSSSDLVHPCATH